MTLSEAELKAAIAEFKSILIDAKKILEPEIAIRESLKAETDSTR